MLTIQPSEETVILEKTKKWVEKAVIGLNLCPFAKSVYVKNQVRFVVTGAETVKELHQVLAEECENLIETDPEVLDTCLLVVPHVFEDFYDFNDFLDIAELTLEELELVGELQIASFHPDYQFADTEADDISNYTNRSPYPILHLIRESSLDKATQQYPDASAIFDSNIEKVTQLGPDGWKKLLEG
ncbi:hypothetical protein GCM10011450_02170 [Advenella faeciporci]|uniref:DUF1415 domain-containing protein n=1 Tax=Advenella faeciporci TaxID=797535 RepID=A0A918MUH5_9BURK|nr:MULTISPECIES: DUF1415 domain-containing protein [Advenella]WKU18759.1 DUF1415 domain-containing protein [Advenella alkanexedens]GGW76159.1 hypothetical protein GCM10011450_02170 [Advenella faeciporci]